MRAAAGIAISPSILFVLGIATGGCGDNGEPPTPEAVSSFSYRGHEYEADMNSLIAGYLALVGTRLDDCQTCHTGGRRRRDALRAIESFDSDEDGYANADELSQGRSPHPPPHMG